MFVPSKTYLRLQRSSACAAVRAAWAMDTPAATFGDKHEEAIVLAALTWKIFGISNRHHRCCTKKILWFQSTIDYFFRTISQDFTPFHFRNSRGMSQNPVPSLTPGALRVMVKLHLVYTYIYIYIYMIHIYIYIHHIIYHNIYIHISHKK